MRGRFAALLGIALLLLVPALFLLRRGNARDATGRTRLYHVAIDATDWTYVPSRGDQAITGRKDDWTNLPEARGARDPNGSTYRKAVFRENKDSTFAMRKPRGADCEHLGMLGPVLRAEVGDTMPAPLTLIAEVECIEDDQPAQSRIRAHG